MVSVRAFGFQAIESWMVPKLFGTAGRDAADGQVATKPAVAAAASSGKVATATAQAIAVLKADSAKSTSPASPDAARAPWYVPGDNNKSVTQSNAISAANEVMTSDEVEAAMYASGIATAGGDVHSPNTTFATIVAFNRQSDADLVNHAINSSVSASDRSELLASAAQNEAFLDQIQKAYDDHTLVFQNAADVKGLDFSETTTFKNLDPNKAATEVDGTESYSEDFYVNRAGKDHSRMLDTGQGMTLYLTW